MPAVAKEKNIMWSSRVTKEQFIHRLLDSINDKTTRRKRGSDEQDLLLRDLENIENIVPRIRKILDNPKQMYTEFEIEQENLQSFSDSIQRATEKA
jgi:hypothetical protein